ncbi:bifunctional glutamine synthetase adenylyltransferase/deadenyltransferase [Candidatus Endobugula sertula]|uniref:Bifunctional glutamine synthetase adenylyltransferase/deadenyltransferase n=1 Tax=Candidatus Endobugula sertula TaxID=62101 RepID=A0A1D2QSP8_9GAMM|nr:bifunctional glutamine synthetase adenylyltransferase/deadenyltransferase [Candidatus Endobugula sertula]
MPRGASSKAPQQLLVLGMGKLGGGELNVSSDIDLIFVFSESGETDSDTASIDNQLFFTRLGKRLIKSLNDVTVDGFVFRVDMRLRPYGQSGALVSSFAALENYYMTQGREWERFAAIKARVVACSTLPDIQQSLMLQRKAYEELDQILLPFTYRKYIDYSVVEALRRLKAMIVQEVRRKGMQSNVKLGTGGIRELEFIVQAFQLIRGGRDVQLQQRHWLAVLKPLCVDQTLDEDVVQQLRNSYLFLRKTEHAIQAYQDQQTQQLPIDERLQNVLSWVMGFDNWQSFLSELDRYRNNVSQQFQWVVADPKDKLAKQAISEEWVDLWMERIDKPEQLLAFSGYSNADAVLEQLNGFRQCWGVKQLSSASREALDQFIPHLLSAAATMDESDVSLLRLLGWLEKIVSRSSYLTFLLENPGVVHQLLVLFQGSVLIVELLTQMPSLLDELLNMESLYTLPNQQELQDDLRQRLLRIDENDLESHMEVLRYFKLVHVLRVAASELSGALPLMKVSDYLTWIAETVLAEVVNLAWQLLVSKHGVPSEQLLGEEDNNCSVNGVCTTAPGFIVVGYGKLGGIELSYNSDLDLVFIYQADAQGFTTGEKPIDNQTFYTRLGQKIIHILNTRTLSGPLYEVDMRLRPSGNSGLLVSSMAAFLRYQEGDAWTWEHQALVRARPIVGDMALLETFHQMRRRILETQRALPELRTSVIEMRQKMRDHLGSSNKNQQKNHLNQGKKALFHLKQDTGGIVDIEFMVQYAVLAWSHEWHSLSQYTDNIRILECLDEVGIIDTEQTRALINVYQRYRQIGHLLALQKQSSLIEEDQFSHYPLASMRQQVQLLWQQLFGAE